ncbi:hypothetical protein GCM10029964_031370 [Kibdelosporangium lantanae]
MQPYADGTHPTAPFAGAESGGRLHLTLSVLCRDEDLDAALRHHSPDRRWDRNLVDTLRRARRNTGLTRAIEPLFDDIADRRRGLFVEDFLIETNRPDHAEPGPDACDLITIEVPERIGWSTEGATMRAELGEPVRFTDVRCRAFWVAHSNLSLSYHLSFEIPYEHTAAHYYALSLLQKVVFPTEGTHCTYRDGADCPTVRAVRDDRFAASGLLPNHIEERFRHDAVDLFRTVLGRPAGQRHQPDHPVRQGGHRAGDQRSRGVDPDGGQRSRRAGPLGDRRSRRVDPDGATLARFLLYRGSADDGVRVTDWDRKLVAVLADPYFFHLLHNDNRGVLSKIDPVRPQAVDGRTLVYRGAALDNLDPDDLAYYFLAGFFQNIIDFLRQDIAEVLDGTDPIYPAAGEQEDPGHVIVYASAGSVFEVVAQSRSLSAGREWIGTCPYLFLVHLMTLHNEDLVRRYEQQVRNLIEHLDQVGPLGTDERREPWRRGWRSEDTFDRFRRFRLTTFNEVQRHRYFNVLRYHTERSFYDSIEEVRGIRQREQYWAGVVTDLEHTVDNLRDAQQRRFDGWRNKLLAAVTVIGVLQVAFQVLDYFFDKDVGQLRWAVGMTLGAVLLACCLVVPWWRIWRRRP